MRELRLPVWPHTTAFRMRPPIAALVGSGVAVAGALASALLLVRFGPVPALAVLIAVLAGILVAVDPRSGLWVVLAIIALLPYAVIPIKVVITPPLLELVGLGVVGTWLLQSFLDRSRSVPFHPLVLSVLLFAGVSLFAFVLGIGRGYTTQTYHDYAKFLISLSLFFLAWSVLRRLADYRRFTTVFLSASGLAAVLGLALYAAGPGMTLAVLARLIPYGYPATRIVRYIEDDPAKPMRLTSTSVDPNSFAGLLAPAFVIAVAQAVARRPVIPRWLAVSAAATIGPALLLTYSRAGWLGAVFGVGLIALARYRWLFLPGSAGLVTAMTLGIGEGVFERLWQGFTLQDPATQMRLEEYRTALALLRAYPAFGVGFGEAPTVELWTGVSSIYLLVAERMGLVGLITFLAAVLGILALGWRTWLRERREDAWSDLLLSWLGAQGALLLIGMFDHYYLNISFPHMVGVFWLVQAIVLRLAVDRRRAERNDAFAGSAVRKR
ncbi:O-antigen ligase family protein [Thermomicrobium sp. 4228-Ro]|uniref:O-antigen ligase family protein n=1 Tax=Thermomicrobium sp. 4228-Ro TaxID=2993937 RepID=UPI0022491292|nr:O-antigen ligase family protein [Thermomicrobium sp. 4228-Ro]MCX2727687.1 O-antigen ligase family protein [Thermomicrobium sp. 4228-Ro]